MREIAKLTAGELDASDKLKAYRDRFIIPEEHGLEKIYLLGNSLGLQPRSAQAAVAEVLQQWAQLGVEGFFMGDKPWMNIQKPIAKMAAKIVGALPEEIVIMNQLTVNLHLMMVSFYRPSGKRRKILCESRAFSSDQYLLESQLAFHGFNPATDLIEVKPDNEGELLNDEGILQAIEEHKEELALVLIGAVNYYTGQVFDIARITETAHRCGALAGFDLAHAAGNIPLKLHDWQVDFACWCNYKYLNSGPGAVGTAFVHARYHGDSSLPRFAGWWGYRSEERFLMKKGFIPESGADGWQLSTPPIPLLALHRAALEIFDEAGIENIFEKGALLSDFAIARLEEIRQGVHEPAFELLTPTLKTKKGSQISIRMFRGGRAVFEHLGHCGIFADWREPDVIRIAPVALYNRFQDIEYFVYHFEKALEEFSNPNV